MPPPAHYRILLAIAFAARYRLRCIGEILALLIGPGATEAWAAEPPVHLGR